MFIGHQFRVQLELKRSLSGSPFCRRSSAFVGYPSWHQRDRRILVMSVQNSGRAWQNWTRWPQSLKQFVQSGDWSNCHAKIWFSGQVKLPKTRFFGIRIIAPYSEENCRQCNIDQLGDTSTLAIQVWLMSFDRKTVKCVSVYTYLKRIAPVIYTCLSQNTSSVSIVRLSGALRGQKWQGICHRRIHDLDSTLQCPKQY